jgi:hypothetical protein
MTDKSLTTTQAGDLAELGQQASETARDSVFADYQARRAENTLRRHRADLGTFARYLTGSEGDAGGRERHVTGQATGRWRLE